MTSSNSSIAVSLQIALVAHWRTAYLWWATTQSPEIASYIQKGGTTTVWLDGLVVYLNLTRAQHRRGLDSSLLLERDSKKGNIQYPVAVFTIYTGIRVDEHSIKEPLRPQLYHRYPRSRSHAVDFLNLRDPEYRPPPYQGMVCGRSGLQLSTRQSPQKGLPLSPVTEYRIFPFAARRRHWPCRKNRPRTSPKPWVPTWPGRWASETSARWLFHADCLAARTPAVSAAVFGAPPSLPVWRFLTR